MSEEVSAQYQLTDEQNMLRDMVRQLAREKVAPGAGARDQTAEYPWEMVEILKTSDLMGPDFPEKYGGGAGLLALAIVVEELSAADASVGLIPVLQELGSLPIILAGTEEQQDRFLPALASGEKLAAFALTEASSGSDVAGFRTRATKVGDEYIINGGKIFISNGGVADTLTVYAVTNPEEDPHKAASVFVLEKGTPGFSVGKQEHKLGIRASDTRELIFDEVRVPVENRLGEEGDGFKIMMKTLDFSRPVIGAQALGIAKGAFEYATSYAKERKAFGKPIMAFQGVSFKLADMAIRTEAARQLLYKTCSILQDLPRDMSKLSAQATRMSSMSKTFASDTAMWVTTEAVQVLAGYGYMSEYPVERMMRDAKITQIYEGTNEIQRLIIVSTL